MGQGRPVPPLTLLSGGGLYGVIMSAKLTFVLRSTTFDGFNVILAQRKKCSLPSLRHALLDRVY
ncbi:hypothetical protein BDM02DRAFT_3118444 [Thelephora ganbajun]|uniref:Uncharacterized protein n=2 Tax=Thelephora ganbajun TaxID=370292 RepID=A0ACB6Z7I9_THEGA|nr:hypothetical protein BDM02DRAFT_3120094 [Thelephora ganbajun]KAF9646521.1 hypothetical protein BDM02DRAFT_3118444 [Thelephora ganbajun]